MQLVAPRAVRMADAMEAISCTINLTVSFLVIAYPPFFLMIVAEVVVAGVTAAGVTAAGVAAARGARAA